ncbi:MAG: alginate lyase family protein [Chitinophagaceae bacterium]
MRNTGMGVLLFCIALTASAQKAELSKSDMVKLDFKALAISKEKIKAKDASLLLAYEQLINTADQALKFNTVSVMDKSDLPPSGDKHDYMSIAPYWWPNPAKPNGVPYIRKDGEINPEIKNFPDKENLPRLCENVYNLALAYYFSGNEEYAKHASKLIKVWFLDSATAMNPNLNFGQAVKGVTVGRAEGLIEVRHFIFLLDGVELLKKSEKFKEGNQKKLKKWFLAFSDWMQTSVVGKDEMESKNNHGVWFDATNLAIAKFIGDKDLVNKIVKSAAERLDVQMDENGLFPLELARTTSLHYSTFIIDAFTIIAQLSEGTDINFWTLVTKSKKSLEKGYEAMLPFWADNTTWTYKEIKPFTMSNAYQCIWRAATKYNCTTCKELIRKNSADYQKLLINLL